jgi:formate-dependent nitrite reductase membrane component NrfD
VEVGLEPACVIVCPETAIIAGDLDDPTTNIARLVATEQVQVRKAEQGTRPKVYYLGADGSALDPTMQAPATRYMWAQRPAAEIDIVRMLAEAHAQERGGAGTLSRPVYDVPHLPRPWGPKVAAYLFTKSVAAGTLLVAGVGVLLGDAAGGWLSGVLAPLAALLFLVLTAGLLIFDLKRPDRFLYILLKPNPRSWLVIGTWILVAYGGVATLWLLAGLAGASGLVHALAVPGLLLAMGAAGYSALLFGQAEGRDFWQSQLLLPQLLVAALVAGAASLVLLQTFAGRDLTGVLLLSTVMWVGVLGHLVLVLAELFGSHANLDAARAARLVTGSWRTAFWGGVVVLGHVLPLVLAWLGPAGAAVAAVLALVGLWIYEDLWVKAGQSIPLS